jgi:hypothetical protein
LIIGEFFFNFGYVGILLMVPIVGMLLRWLDGRLSDSADASIDGPLAGLRYAVAVIAGSGLIDLMWMGAFSYTARTGVRLLVIAVLALFIAMAGLSRRSVGEVEPVGVS